MMRCWIDELMKRVVAVFGWRGLMRGQLTVLIWMMCAILSDIGACWLCLSLLLCRVAAAGCANRFEHLLWLFAFFFIVCLERDTLWNT